MMDRAIAVAHEEIGVYIAQGAHVRERLDDYERRWVVKS
jgi:hypothetical protein